MKPVDISKVRAKAVVVFAAVFLFACASPRNFVINESKTWSLQDAPALEKVITVPISNAKDVVSKLAPQKLATSEKGKFETDEAYSARQQKTPASSENAFFVKPLNTRECTSYDFKRSVFKIDCKAFRPDDVLTEEAKATGKRTTLANAYRSREIEFYERREYSAAVITNAQAEIAVSNEEAKRIDNELMVGVLISTNSYDSELDGCGEIDLKLDISKACKQSAFNSGAAVYTFSYSIKAEEILATVIYVKSTGKVLAHKTFTLQK